MAPCIHLYRVRYSALGRRIVHCLVVSNFWIHCHWESGELIEGQYPDAMDTCKYGRKAFVNDTLPIPGPIFSVPFYPDNPNMPPSYSSSNFLALFVNTIFFGFYLKKSNHTILLLSHILLLVKF